MRPYLWLVLLMTMVPLQLSAQDAFSPAREKAEEAWKLERQERWEEAVVAYEEALDELATGVARSFNFFSLMELAWRGVPLGPLTARELQLRVLPRVRMQVDASGDLVALAVFTATRVSRAKERSLALTGVAGALLDAGLKERVVSILRRALVAASRVRSGPGKEIAVYDIGEKFARAGQLEAARMVARPLKRPDPIIGDIIIARAEAGDVDGALGEAQTLRDPAIKARALGETLEVMVERGALDRALVEAERLKDNRWRTAVVANVAEKIARRGDCAAAEKLAERLKTPVVNPSLIKPAPAQTPPQVMAWIRILPPCVEAGKVDEALSLVSRISQPHLQIRALVAMAEAAPGAPGEAWLKEARGRCGDLKKKDRRARSLIRLARAWRKRGNDKLALSLLQEAHELLKDRKKSGLGDPRLMMLMEWGALGRCDEAEEKARSVGHGFWTQAALSRVAVGCAEAGRFQEAERLAQSVNTSFWRNAALGDLAEHLAKAGRFADAVRVAGMIIELRSRASALVRVAVVQAESSAELAADVKAEMKKLIR